MFIVDAVWPTVWAGAGAPSLRSAFVSALSFMGTGMSSSELSFNVENC